MNVRRHAKIRLPGLVVGLLLLSALLVWHDLGVREVLGRDENLTIAHVDQPSLEAVLAGIHMKATGQPSNMQPFYFLLQYLLWPLVGRSAFMLRFLPSVCGLLCVVMTYKVGGTLWGREPATSPRRERSDLDELGRVVERPVNSAGLVGALLTALLLLHVQYSQIARPYAFLALWSVASAYFLMRALKTGWSLHWAGFVLTATLNLYTHYNGLFVLAAEGLFSGVVWLVTLGAVLKKRQSPRRLVGPVMGFLAVGVLFLPGLIRLSKLPWVGSSGEVAVELTIPFFYRFLYRIGLTTPWLRGLILGLMGLGLAATLYQRRWQSALFVLLWLAVPFVILSVMKSPRPFAERYVIFVPPVALLLAGQGVAAVGEVFGALARWWRAEGVRWAVTVAVTIGLALLLAPPLRAYYADNRAADRIDLTLTVVERHARPGDVIIISPRFFVRPLVVDGPDVLYLTEHLSPAGFEELLSGYQRMWVLYTSYLPPVELQEPLDQWIQARGDEFARVPIKAITALAYHNQALIDPEALLKDRITLLEELAGISADRQEAWLRYSVLADTYEALGELYDSQGEPTLAADYREKAEEARAAAPRPW